MNTTIDHGIRLVPATLHQLELEEISGSELAGELGVASPPSWPPEYNGPETRAWIRDALRASPQDAAWYAWYVVATNDGAPTLAGISGFKGPPSADGTVEIGYSIVPELRRRGLATIAVQLLCERAFASGASKVVAETLPSLVASQGVLIKTGFRRFEILEDPAVGVIWRYRLDPELPARRIAGPAPRL
jgi:RimJ/RimL family protein N-acetyltransferase